MSLKSLLSRWRSDPTISENIVAWQTQPPKAATFFDFPDYLHPEIIEVLEAKGIRQLYTHQYDSLTATMEGNNIAVATDTASGKSYCYLLPILNELLNNPESKALLLYPTKALTQDQFIQINSLCAQIQAFKRINVHIYDGDTPTNERQFIRNNGNLILTNPDMLHTGILPHHTAWYQFFSSLKYVVIDEMHTYRGVFGSHFANLIRRLKRITHFYNAYPHFILTSATIANPGELAEKLIEEEVTLIDRDGAPQGQRHFMIYNPPMIDQKLGIRKSSLTEGTKIASEVIQNGIQTIIFGRTRRIIELILTYLRNTQTDFDPSEIRGYRSGYLQTDRREIEEGLRSGKVRAVAATSALELGIDIGDLEAAILIGYPGSISASRQQAGRAGRKSNVSLAILITAANAMDQYLAMHPEYFFERSPEQALIESNNLLILMQHIRSAAFELPFKSGQCFGKLSGDLLSQFLILLTQAKELHQQGDTFYWTADKYPAADISLRSASPDMILLQVGTPNGKQSIGQVDRASSYWMVHPEAIYIHEGQAYQVDQLDLEKSKAILHPAEMDYFTEPHQEISIVAYQTLYQTNSIGCVKYYGSLQIQSQVVAYRKLRWFTREHIGGGQVDMPPCQLDTVGYWLSINETVVNELRKELLWNADANDYGKDWQRIRSKVLERDGYHCKVCGASDVLQPLHVHHIQPFKTFVSLEAANALSNLITLCPACHRQAEQSIRIRSGLAGMSYVLSSLAPLLIMCDSEDIGVHAEVQSQLGDNQPTIVIYDNIPGGIGLSERLYDQHLLLLRQAMETVQACPCIDGCPSCVGPIGEAGYGGKKETLALLKALI